MRGFFCLRIENLLQFSIFKGFKTNVTDLIMTRYRNPLVIGAGMIGSSVTYHLTKMGYSVKWFDSMPFGWFSTSRAAGLILQGSKGDSASLTRATLRDIDVLEKELGEDLGFVRCGSVAVGVDSVTWKEEKEDGYIDPMVLAGAYRRAATDYTFMHEKVDDLLVEDGKVLGLRAGGNDFFGDVIDCGGSWLGRLAMRQRLIQHLPFFPLRSHYFHVRYHSSPTILPAMLMDGMYVRHNGGDSYLLGIREKQSYCYSGSLPNDWRALDKIKTDDTDDILMASFDRIQKVFTDIENLEIVDYTAGFSNYTADGRYLIGEVCDGLYFAGGDCGSGIGASGGMGHMVAQKTFMDIYCPLRFTGRSLQSLRADILSVRGKKR